MNDSHALVTSHAAGASLAERAAHQLTNYWRVRIHQALDRLEYEARRMLTLEAAFGAFAEEYHATISEAVARLIALEEQLPQSRNYGRLCETEELTTYLDIRANRQAELKNRYRLLAKQIHPDSALNDTGNAAMQQLNEAYARQDLAALLRVEAHWFVDRIGQVEEMKSDQLEYALLEVSRAAESYKQSYRALLNAPFNELLLRSLSAERQGWDWIQAIRQRIKQAIEVKERSLAVAHGAMAAEWAEAQVA